MTLPSTITETSKWFISLSIVLRTPSWSSQCIVRHRLPLHSNLLRFRSPGLYQENGTGRYTSNNLLTIGGKLKGYPVLGSIISTKGFCDLEVFTTGFDPRLMVHGSHHSLTFDLINNAGERVGCSNITLVLEIKYYFV